MSYCLNPVCPSPQNVDEAELCQCGAKLRLRDRYVALKPIGQGGFGRTLLAVNLAQPTKPLCVIKQFFPTLGVDREKATILFREEAQRLKQLGNHPQIPDLLGYLEQEGQQYLIQEFIDGRNLEQELGDRGAFSELEIRQLLLDLLPVLQFMHDRRVIHRDIKPANIIRRAADDKLVLVDMGAAKYATGTAIAKTGTVIGSAEYTAPEQTRGKAVYASDIYSLSVTCVHLLTQMSPFDLFDGSDDRWIWRDYLSVGVSNLLGEILDRMLQDGTNRRYRSAKDVLQDFYHTNQAEHSSVSPSRYWKSPSSSMPKQSPSNLAQERSTRVQPDWKFEQRGEMTAPSGGRSQPVKVLRARKVWIRAAVFGVMSLLLPLMVINLFMVVHLLTSESIQPERSPVIAPSAPPQPTRSRITSISPETVYGKLAISPDGEIVVNAKRSTIEVWRVATGELINEFPNPMGQPSNVVAIAIGSVKGGEQLAIEELNGSIIVIDLHTEQQIITINIPDGLLPVMRQSALRIDSSGRILTRESGEGTLGIWDLETGELIHAVRKTGEIIGSTGEFLTVFNRETSTLTRLDAETGRQMQTLPLPRDLRDPFQLRLSANGRTLLSATDATPTDGGWSSTFTAWDIDRGTSLGEFTYTAPTRSLLIALSPDGNRVAIANGAQIQIRSFPTGRQIWSFSSSSSNLMFPMLFSPDGKTLITQRENGRVVFDRVPN